MSITIYTYLHIYTEQTLVYVHNITCHANSISHAKGEKKHEMRYNKQVISRRSIHNYTVKLE